MELISDLTIGKLLRQSASRWPDRPALREALGYRAELVAGLTGEI